MKRRILLLILSVFLSIPFWFLVNASQFRLESFLAEQMGGNIMTAQASQELLERISLPKVSYLDITAEAAVSAIVKNGNFEIIYSKNSSQKLPIASLTKLMTSLVVFDLKGSYKGSDEIKITREALEKEGDSNLKEGDVLNVDNLTHMALIESSNDAAYALTSPLGRESFVSLMNLYAEDIGMKKTKFYNPTGLDPDEEGDPLNNSTAEDLVLLASHILNKHPEIFNISKKNSFEVLKRGGIFHHFIPENTNKLLKDLPQIEGGKTGWTLEAKGCLLVLIKDLKKDRLFINVVLGSRDRFSDMRKIIKEVNRINTWEN